MAIFAFWYARLTNQDQGKQLDKTLAAQREQLDKTLAAQREQLDTTLTRTLNERFATAAGQLGGDKPAAVRLAGVYAMAGLADDWRENRQTCVDVLCGYLRLPYDPDPGNDAKPAERAAYRANREVRHTIIRLIGDHLRGGAARSWEGLNFDFTSVIFDGGDFNRANFSGGIVRFDRAEFSGGEVSFFKAEFSGGEVSFLGAEFSGGRVSFEQAKFSGGRVSFSDAVFSGGTVSFQLAAFADGVVSFFRAKFSDGAVNFFNTQFSHGTVNFDQAKFSGCTVRFDGANFSSGWVPIRGAEFSGGTVDFGGARFSGGMVDFSSSYGWSFPPAFPWTGTAPPGVKLPDKEDPSQD